MIMAYQKFEAYNRFMFRMPTSCNKSGIPSEEELLQACGNAAFREKLKIASPSLLGMIDNYLCEPNKLSEKKTKELFCSIAKYYIRSLERTTPFGLFAAVGIGSFGDDNSFSAPNNTFSKSINPDAGWLWEYISDLESEYCERLNFKLNPAFVTDGSRASLLFTTTQNIEEISVRKTHALDIVMNVCSEYVHFFDILKKLASDYSDTDEVVLIKYLKELISKQMLISDLRPCLTECGQLIQLIVNTRKCIPEIATALEKLQCMLDEYESTGIGFGSKLYDGIVEYMKMMHKSRHYLHVDTFTACDTLLTLDSNIKNQIEALAELLVSFSAHSQIQKRYLTQYREKFIEKYGLERLVPLTEMLDTNIGIGAPFGYTAPANDFYEEYTESFEVDKPIRNYLLKKYEKAIRNGTSIMLHNDELKRLAEVTQNANSPMSFELFFRLRKVNGAIKLYLSDIGGSPRAGKAIGRFASSNNEFAQMVYQMNGLERKLYGNVKSCEISFLPARMRSGNVVQCCSGRELLLSAYIGESKTTESIQLKDILIGVFGDRFFAVDAQSRQRLVFEMNNMYNPLLQPNTFRFLIDITHEGEIDWSEFPWRYVFRYFKHIPRIETEYAVISEEQWFVSLYDLGNVADYASFTKAIRHYAAEEGIPNEIYLVENDNRISLNLEDSISLQILFDAMKRIKDESVLLQRKEEGSDLECGGSEYATEIVVPIFCKEAQAHFDFNCEQQLIARNEHIVLPYSRWLFFKLYCKTEREQELIALELNAFGKILEEKYGVSHFYMRYIDSKPHIRLRFHSDPKSLLEATPMIMQWIARLHNDNLVGEMTINQYERETERYGGSALIEYAEAVFVKDSVIMEDLLLLLRLQKTELSLVDIAILSVMKYLECFFDDFAQMLDFCNKYYFTNKYRDEFKRARERYMKLFDIENSWNGFMQTTDGNAIVKLLNTRREAVIAYSNAIKNSVSATASIENIIASVLHLSCNRLLGTNREAESKVMSFTASLLYSKKHLLEVKK